MPFTVKEFPGQRFESHEEYQEARRKRRAIEESLASRPSEDITNITATIIPAPKQLVEAKVVELERRLRLVEKMMERSSKSPTVNNEGLKVGSTLQGESQGRRYTLEVLEEGYLCSDGKIYESLSGAALGVSGNRRSGWRFWRNAKGYPVGEATGRFEASSDGNGSSST